MGWEINMEYVMDNCPRCGEEIDGETLLKELEEK
jgi:predicted RNA-binding Zn-ribbon protein involved in translation (DUF1610 family)